MSGTPSAFVHRFEPSDDPSARTLLLLHGTGGNESSLLGLGRALAPRAALLAPRGKVLENGMPRFFRRFAEGVFDEADLRERAGELAAFVSEARTTYGLPSPVALGFSNGANIAAAVLLLHPDVLAGAILLRAMAPFTEAPAAELRGKPVLLLSGSADPIVPEETAARLVAQLEGSGAHVEHHVLPAGHELTHADMDLTQAWLAKHAML